MWLRTWLAGALSITLALLFPAFDVRAEAAPRLVGNVTKVVDGDTIEVRLSSGPIRVRFHGIDTPERNQPWGKQATQALSAMLMDKQVELEPLEQDRYDRLVAIVFVGDVNVNAELARQGHAWAYRKYMRKSDASLCTLEAEARESRRGLWSLSDEEIQAPWDWRRIKMNRVAYSRATAADCVAAIGRRTMAPRYRVDGEGANRALGE